ncbi:MAG: DUF4335 domain-containing protein [Leptolyngbyaceae cyanobacterium RU_5_1]|nr:DUF4335 domain-containing protein [Leptolyngbyaceae cyanobacterium RU_5_1]
MTIQRQYSLPNCTLTVEGLGDALSLSPSDVRPLLSILINAEFRLTGLEKPMSGGREFLDGLVNAVSQYAQEILSGLHAAKTSKQSDQLVQIHQVDENVHRLSVRSQPVDGIVTDQSVTEVDLNTVQLFDLVEAVDQLLADTQTLPDLSLDLKPLTRREIVKAEPIGKRAIPAVIGVSGLAAAAIALSMLPVPKVEPPKDLYPVRGATPTPGISPSPGAPPTSGTPSPKPDSTASPASPSPSASASPDLKKLAAALASPEITDAARLDTLGQQLRAKVDQSWTSRSALPNTLVYQVGVSQDGEILGYKAVNQVSLDNANKTPLLNLVYRRAIAPLQSNLPNSKWYLPPVGFWKLPPGGR